MSFTFGGRAQQQPAQGSFAFGQPQQQQQHANRGFGFNTTPAASGGTTTLPAFGSTTTIQPGGLQFGGVPATSTAAAAPPFGFCELQFGLPKTSSKSPFSAATTPGLGSTASTMSTSTPAPLNFSMSNTTSTASTATSNLLTTSKPVSITAFSFAPAPATSTPAATSGFAFPKTTTATSTTPSSLFNPAMSSAPTTTSAVLTTTTTVTPSIASISTMNFRQLEDSMNKWKIELEEQEKMFIDQATQVNAWDRLLISNGEKTTVLNDAVERVKLNQKRLDLDLDFIVAQQSELEELLKPLEKSMESTPNINVQQHADLEREHTYHLAENINALLTRMSKDIREIIEHVNTANKTQDDNDPVQQIAKILNAHMDALQWVDQNTVGLQQRLEGVSKLYGNQKRESEKTFRGYYTCNVII